MFNVARIDADQMLLFLFLKEDSNRRSMLLSTDARRIPIDVMDKENFCAQNKMQMNQFAIIAQIYDFYSIFHK